MTPNKHPQTPSSRVSLAVSPRCANAKGADPPGLWRNESPPEVAFGEGSDFLSRKRMAFSFFSSSNFKVTRQIISYSWSLRALSHDINIAFTYINETCLKAVASLKRATLKTVAPLPRRRWSTPASAASWPLRSSEVYRGTKQQKAAVFLVFFLCLFYFKKT